MIQNISKVKYFLYTRKSSESEDRQVQSIPDQLDRLTKLASELNLNIVKTYTESKSAKMGLMDRIVGTLIYIVVYRL